MKFLVVFVLFFYLSFLQAQNSKKDTIVLDEVVITATKTKKQLRNITVPVQLIKERDINQMASIRLQDVLTENTGLSIQHYALGIGIQMQGLNSDYTLIMVNGKPIVGRLNGVLDLSRIPTENIAQIEIVKGPSSVLYGSDALAGVINIITKDANTNKAKIGIKTSSFETHNLFANIDLFRKEIQSSFFVNYYQTQGYTLNSNYQGYDSSSYYNKTISPHSNYNISNNTDVIFSKKSKLNVSSYFFKENQNYDFMQLDSPIKGNGSITDWQISPTLNYIFSDKLQSKLSYQLTNYQTENNEIYTETNQKYNDSYFKQDYQQIELQNDYVFNKINKTTLGVGYINEGVQTSKLISDGRQQTNNLYTYIQHQITTEKYNVVLGARLEKHDAYNNQFNPKLSFLYRLKPTIQVRASIGRGFKRPTFKQLFFNYTNEAIGYTILGTTYVEQGMQNLLDLNQIAINPETNQPVIYDAYYTILSHNGVIEPESSYGYNLGFKITSFSNTILDINFFRNDLENLIDTTPIALKTNGWRAYSYLNLNRVFTYGGDINIKYRLNNKIQFSLGYQYLEAKDKDVLDKINSEGIYAQDPVSLQSYRISEKNYGGLFNRSKHSGNFKAIFTNFYKKISANIRFLYTGRYGFADLNNNQILDIEKEYTKGYMLVNTAISKNFLSKKMQIKLGIDNLFDFTYIEPEFTITSLPGRIFYTTINYTF